MAENTKRSVFALDGVTGMLIATTLLLSILAFLTTLAIKTQQENATKYYQLKDVNNLKKISTDNAKHYQLVK